MSQSSKPRRPPVYGPELWSTSDRGTWSHWDLWFCAVAVADHGADVNRGGRVIPRGAVTEWQARVPWPQPYQVEQDLILRVRASADCLGRALRLACPTHVQA